MMSSSSEEEYDGVWTREMVEPYQCEPLARPSSPKPPPAKRPKIIVDRSVGYPPDATRLFAPDSTTEEDEEEEEVTDSQLSQAAEIQLRVFMDNRFGQNKSVIYDND